MATTLRGARARAQASAGREGGGGRAREKEGDCAEDMEESGEDERRRETKVRLAL